MLKKIKNALISVSDKENIIKVLRSLDKHNVKIISSGGTYKYIRKLGYNCIEISKYTGFKEMRIVYHRNIKHFEYRRFIQDRKSVDRVWKRISNIFHKPVNRKMSALKYKFRLHNITQYLLYLRAQNVSVNKNRTSQGRRLC